MNKETINIALLSYFSKASCGFILAAIRLPPPIDIIIALTGGVPHDNFYVDRKYCTCTLGLGVTHDLDIALFLVAQCIYTIDSPPVRLYSPPKKDFRNKRGASVGVPRFFSAPGARALLRE